MNEAQITAASNGGWWYLSAVWAGLLFYARALLDGSVHDGVRQNLFWSAMGLLVLSLRPVFWNLAIWLAGPGERHAEVIAQYRAPFTALSVAALAVCVWMALRPYLEGVSASFYHRFALVAGFGASVLGAWVLVDVL